MLFHGHPCTGLFVMAIVYRFVVATMQRDSGHEHGGWDDMIMNADLGKEADHVIATRSDLQQLPLIGGGGPSKCFLLDLQAEIKFRSPKNPADAKQTNIIIDTSKGEYTFYGCPFDEHVTKTRNFTLSENPNYGLRFNILQSEDRWHWYVNSIMFMDITDLQDPTFSDFDNLKILVTDLNEFYMETPLDMSFACRDSWKLPLYDGSKIVADLHFNQIRLQVYNIRKDFTYSPELVCGSKVIQSHSYGIGFSPLKIIIGTGVTFLIIVGIAIIRCIVKKRRNASSGTQSVAYST